ncbi:efflux RND transporter periplasmic adaptor subunit [Hamadaea tsunoensis]|uniref:efflux RND transporter periplasmic adaptor subunit n=1 Tax=Hamadaea tsunoensis TaxID=53368 RepID=UPI00040892AC|nr:biotin/lipoyl-binding protein [Hamadaea tsunoensis]
MRWIVAVAAGVVALAVAGGLLWYAESGTPQTKPAAQTVQRVAATGVTAKGTVQPVTTQSLSFSVSGTVTAVTVKPGDMVTTGQVLARIDQADAKLAVADAQSALDDAQAALDDAWASASASPSAQTCNQGGGSTGGGSTGGSTGGGSSTGSGSTGHSSSASPAPSASETAASTAAPASSGVVAHLVAYTAPQGCSTAGTTGRQGSGGNGGDAILSAQQTVNNDRAALAKAQRELDGTIVTAPAAGKILTVTIKVGDTARSNVITLGVVSTMVVKASFSEADVVALTVGQQAQIALPGKDGETYTAKITQIAETGTISSNLVTYQVILTFDQVPQGILVGQSANVTVETA